MQDAEYWREQAARLRERAETTTNPSRREECLELAEVCEEVAETMETRSPGG